MQRASYECEHGAAGGPAAGSIRSPDKIVARWPLLPGCPRDLPVTPITCTFPTHWTARHARSAPRSAAAAAQGESTLWGRDGTPLVNSRVRLDLPHVPISLSSLYHHLSVLHYFLIELSSSSCVRFWAGEKAVQKSARALESTSVKKKSMILVMDCRQGLHRPTTHS